MKVYTSKCWAWLRNAVDFGYRALRYADIWTKGSVTYDKLSRGTFVGSDVECDTWFETSGVLPYDKWYDEPRYNDHLVYNKPSCTGA